MPKYVLHFTCVLWLVLAGYSEAADNTFDQLKLELKSAGVSDVFIKTTESSVKKMIACSAPAADIKSVLLDLWNEGVKARALKNAVAAVAELIANGDNTLEAAKVASGAAHQAEAEGLSGWSVGMRVKKAVQERKTYLQSLKKENND